MYESFLINFPHVHGQVSVSLTKTLKPGHVESIKIFVYTFQYFRAFGVLLWEIASFGERPLPNLSGVDIVDIFQRKGSEVLLERYSYVYQSCHSNRFPLIYKEDTIFLST